MLAVDLQRVQDLASRVVGIVQQDLLIQQQHVEDQIADRHILPNPLHGSASQAKSLLQQTEIRASTVAEGDDLAIQDGPATADQSAQLGQFGECRGDVPVGAAAHHQVVAVDVGDSPDPVPLSFQPPGHPGRQRGQAAQCGKHRRQHGGHGHDPATSPAARGGRTRTLHSVPPGGRTTQQLRMHQDPSCGQATADATDLGEVIVDQIMHAGTRALREAFPSQIATSGGDSPAFMFLGLMGAAEDCASR